jgi:hypothetical protein
MGGVRCHLSPDYQEHEGAKADLKRLVPEDAREAIGHGLRANRRGRFCVIDAFGVRAPTKRPPFSGGLCSLGRIKRN